MNSLKDSLIEIVGPVISDENAELVAVEVKGKPGSQTIKIFVDTENGIMLDHCVKISREIADRLDMLDVMPGKYRLEVSSPGIDRPLTGAADFRRNLNRDVTVTYRQEAETVAFEGSIKQVSEDFVLIAGKDEEREIHFRYLTKGQLSLPW